MGSKRGEPARAGLVVMALVGLIVLAIGLVATRDGLYIGLRDAPTYLSSSENLANGNGFVMSFGDPGKPIDFASSDSPVVDFPAGYPITLSAGVAAGLSSTDWARWLGIALMTSIAVVVAWVALDSGLSVSWAGLAALIGAALSLPYVVSPMSELLYGLLLVTSLGLLGRFARRRGEVFFVVGALTAAAAMTVRTIGIALLATAVVVGLLTPGRKAVRGLRLLFTVVVGAVPIALLIGGGGSRELAWHPAGSVDLKVMANTIAGWFIPPLGGPTMRVALLVVVVAALFLWVRSGVEVEAEAGERVWRRLWFPGAVSALAHFTVLVVSRFVFDAQNTPNPRLLYPTVLSLLVAGVAGFPELRQEGRSARRRKGLALISVAMLVAASWGAAQEFGSASDASSFGSEAFRTSPAVTEVLDMSPDVLVFSNVPDGLWAAGRSGVRPLPVTVDPLSTRPNPLLEEETDRIQSAVEAGAVIFYRRGDRDYLLGIDEVRAMAPCVVVDDGTSLVLTGESDQSCGA
ncbi:MAG: hypothetical protein WB245_13795 [Acidimicrobiia bacterium]